ncbi:MAG: hypothetical protein P1U56_01755 [Saprospiraceae bacterium]|nr:hypothetical protein [Saprospiraceae bacterium]
MACINVIYTTTCKGIWLAVLLHLGCFLSVNGQEIWTPSQYLGLNQTQKESPYRASLDFLENDAKGMPFIDNYEFRTETSENDFAQQQFQLRFQFNSSDERKAYDKVLSTHAEKYKLLEAQYESDIWEEKYKNIVALYFIQREENLWRQDIELIKDKKKVLQKILDNTGQLDVAEWISNETELSNLYADSLELALKRNEIGFKIFSIDRDVPRVDDTQIISVDAIVESLSTLKDEVELHPDIQLLKVEEKLAEAEFELEDAESKKWLKFAQLEYQSDNNESFQNELSFSTSIIIPNKNNNRIKKNDVILDVLEQKYKTSIEREEGEKEFLLLGKKLEGLHIQLTEFLRICEVQDLEGLFQSYAEKKSVSPIFLIGIKRSILKNEKKQLKIEKDIYDTYINLLSKTGAFIKTPRKNYLTN